MKKLIPLCSLLFPLFAFLGCGESTPPAPATEAEYKANLPDEVREAEAKFEQKAKDSADKHAPKKAR